MDESWLGVTDAAAELGVSPQRVRSLLDAGALRGRKLGMSWFVDPQAVRQRAAYSRQSGRPLSARNAWRCLTLLEPFAQPGEVSFRGQLHEIHIPFAVNAVERSRLRALFADLPDPEGLGRRLAGRARIRRMRAHPGVLDKLLSDPRVSLGGGHAVASRGGGVAAGGQHRGYVSARFVDALIRHYRLRDDVEGNIELAIIPGEVDDELLPHPGSAVSLAVGWVDLLDDPDPRARSAAHDWVARLPRSLIVADGRRR